MKRRPPRQPGEPVIRPIDYTINECGCWVWNWSVERKGYATIVVDGKHRKAHRVAYELGNGPIPEGHILRHLCNNPSCINPAHLVAGTQVENSRDMIASGNMWNQKLTLEDVAEIRRWFAAGGVSRAAIARYYGVVNGDVQLIIANKIFYDENYTPPPKGRSRKNAEPIGKSAAKEIRRLHRDEGVKRKQLAKKFNLSRGAVDSIVNNLLYPDPDYSPPVREKKLTDDQVAEIRGKVAAGVPRKRLADEYGVSLPLINQIVAGKIYKGRPQPQPSVKEDAAPPRPTLKSLNGPAPTSKSEQERRQREQAEQRGPDMKPYRKADDPIIKDSDWGEDCDWKLNPETGCHKWRWGKMPSGHGTITPKGDIKETLAHRASWILHNKRLIPEGHQINHLCDNPPCINPAHLYVGDQFDNMRDTVWRGFNHATQKLTPEQAKEIRDRYEPGVISAKELGQQYGVNASQILNIISNKSFPDHDYIPKNPEFNLNRRLRQQDADTIRERWQTERISFHALAREYQVDRSVISEIVYNKTYYDRNYTPPSIDERRLWKLSPNDKTAILAELQAGATRKELAEKYGIGKDSINAVIRKGAAEAGLSIPGGRNEENQQRPLF